MRRWTVVLSVLSVCFALREARAQDETGDVAEDVANEVADEVVEDVADDIAEEVAAVSDSGEESEAPGWWIEPYGRLRLGLEFVAPFVDDDPNFTFIGRNDGFVLDSARLGLFGENPEHHISFQLSLEAASAHEESPNRPIGELDVRVRDAYVRQDPIDHFGTTLGLFKLPFSAEEMRSTGALVFPSRAVGVEGVRNGRGLQEDGIELGRQLGIMLSNSEPWWIDDLGVAVAFAVTNGNSDDLLLNDNSSFAFTARLDLHYSDYVRLGAAYLMNDRTVGDPPNRFEESDTGFSGDLLLRVEGLEVFGQLTSVVTEYPTVGTDDRERQSTHVQASYRFDFLEDLPFAVAYRLAMYDPFAGSEAVAGQIDLSERQLLYHTFGLTFWHYSGLPMTHYIYYTVTGEEAPRETANDRLEIVWQLLY
jgi:hypothetical protein